MKISCLTFLLALVIQRSALADLPSGWAIGWGNNISGAATGIASSGNIFYSTGVVQVAGQELNNIVAISAGTSHGLALKSDGTVYGWGSNLAGEVAGFTTDYLHSKTNGQVTIAGQTLVNVMAISAGVRSSLALKRDGTVVAWGQTKPVKASSPPILNDNPPLEKNGTIGVDPATGMPVDLNNILPSHNEMKGSLNLEFKGDGTVMTWIGNKEPAPLNDVVAIASGDGCSLALKNDGTVIGWYSEAFSGLSNIVAIAVGKDRFLPYLALSKDGTVVEWSPGGEQEQHIVASNAVAISCGATHCLALQRDGTVFAWGSNGAGEATGTSTTMAPYRSNGLVTIDGQILNNITAIAAGNGFSLALKKSGTVVAWGRMGNEMYPATVPAGLTNVVAIAAGDNFGLAITTNSAVADKFRH